MLRFQQFSDFIAYLLICKACIDALYIIFFHQLLISSVFDQFVCFLHYRFPALIFQQINSGLEGNEIAHTAHINTVTIRVTDLWC
ncbi:hypothetical protein D9M68_825440 [compost metagenome]